ncbi:MAG: alpha-glucosidase C-terminal domain-containing protein, partial [Oscillospiraceae bacterium]|nr:alpha-glucosidase C-terminal domain-containing protein [Oscillospiraceae bacterium]
DNARTPYQWDGSENAGFTTGTPWLKLNPQYTEINLEADRKSADSIFAFYQTLIRMRKEQPAIVDGDLRFLLDEHQQILMYLRCCEKQTMLVVTNYSGEEAVWEMPEELKGKRWNRILTNVPENAPAVDTGRVLQPWEAEIYVMGE